MGVLLSLLLVAHLSPVFAPALADQEEDEEDYEVEILGLDPYLPIPEDNPITDEKIALGRALYFDPRLSIDGTVSCATCHDPKEGWSNGEAVATGVGGQRGGRSSPTVINAAYSPFQFWDGRASSLEEQALGPIQNPIEMGHTLEGMISGLTEIEGYRESFEKVFGDGITAENVAKAIAAFERTLLSGNSPVDRFEVGEEDAISESAKRGLKIFKSKKGNCSTCHAGFNFTDDIFHNLGVGWNATERDLGRWAVLPEGERKESDKGAFKTPTLRDIALTAPYMHDGSEKTLMEVVEFYERGGQPNPHLDKEIKPLTLTDQDKDDLIELLKALTGDVRPDGTPPKLPR